ncbi:MAG: YraN family protein [Thiobacillus sp.]
MLKTLLGQSAEARAEVYLKQQGLLPVARNWRCRFGEIDLIMRDRDTLVFVEVRLRNHRHFGDGFASVTASKQHKLLAAARQYLSTLKSLPPCRFDVVAMRDDATPDWLKNAFEDAG